jgi:hypothetical protein
MIWSYFWSSSFNGFEFHIMTCDLISSERFSILFHHSGEGEEAISRESLKHHSTVFLDIFDIVLFYWYTICAWYAQTKILVIFHLCIAFLLILDSCCNAMISESLNFRHDGISINLKFWVPDISWPIQMNVNFGLVSFRKTMDLCLRPSAWMICQNIFAIAPIQKIGNRCILKHIFVLLIACFVSYYVSTNFLEPSALA